jgi:hypothetical protein
MRSRNETNALCIVVCSRALSKGSKKVVRFKLSTVHGCSLKVRTSVGFHSARIINVVPYTLNFGFIEEVHFSPLQTRKED